MPTDRKFVAAILAVVHMAGLISGCGGKGGETDTASGEVTGSTGTTDTPSTTDTPTTGTSSPTTGDPTTGDPIVCEDPSTPEVGPEVKIVLQNAGDGTIWVDEKIICNATPPFELRDAADGEIKPVLRDCDFRCEEVIAGDCGCQAGCGNAYQVVQIDPGASYEVAWSGVHWATTPLSDTCTPDGCEPSCLVRTQAPDGVYKVTARSSGAVTDCDAQCSCAPNADGWCVMEGIRSGSELVVEAMLDYPAQTEITLVFP